VTTPLQALEKQLGKATAPISHRPSWRSSEKTAVLGIVSVSKGLRPEKGPEENMDEVPSDS